MTLREKMEAAKAAGKQEPPADQPPGAGLKISASSSPSGSSASGACLSRDQLALLLRSSDNRAIGATEGEIMPGISPSSGDPTWDAAMESLDRDMVVWVDRETGSAWIAIERRDTAAPLALLFRLPLSSRCRPGDPF